MYDVGTVWIYIFTQNVANYEQLWRKKALLRFYHLYFIIIQLHHHIEFDVLDDQIKFKISTVWIKWTAC